MAINRSANSVIREFHGKTKRRGKNKGDNVPVQTERDNTKLFLKIAVLNTKHRDISSAHQKVNIHRYLKFTTSDQYLFCAVMIWVRSHRHSNSGNDLKNENRK